MLLRCHAAETSVSSKADGVFPRPVIQWVTALAAAVLVLPLCDAVLAQPPPNITVGPTFNTNHLGRRPPILDSPMPAIAIAHADASRPIVFRWHPDPNQSAPVRYVVCIAEPGAECRNGRSALVLGTTEGIAAAGTVAYETGVMSPLNRIEAPGTPISATAASLRMPTRFQGKRVQWSVQSCGPDLSQPYPVGARIPEMCSDFASARAIGWAIPAPQLKPPITSIAGGYNLLRPRFGINAAVPWADTYIFCISQPGLACGTSPVSTGDQLVVRGSELYFEPPAALIQFAGRVMHWTAAACNAELGCTYQNQYLEIAFPVVGPVPPAPSLSTPLAGIWVNIDRRNVNFYWQAADAADHYTLCVSPPGIGCGAQGSVEVTGIKDLSVLRMPNDPWPTGPVVNWTVAACNNIHQCSYQQDVRPLRISPAIQSTIDILTYNIYMRPTELFKNGQDIRARLMPDYVHGHDVIVFNEAFDDTVRSLLLQGLAVEYPYRTNILGTASLGVDDGGVMIVSRWPIIDQAQTVFGSLCSGWDCSADKGVVYAKVCKNNRPFHVFGTHMQAGQQQMHHDIRRAQLLLIRNFIDNLNIPATEPVVIAGDFNIRRDAGTPSAAIPHYGNQRTPEFNFIEQDLKARYPGPANVMDLWPARCTYCYGWNGLASDQSEGRVTLDYITTSLTHLQPNQVMLSTIRIQSTPWSEFLWEPLFVDLSDHYPVRGRLTFEGPADQGC